MKNLILILILFQALTLNAQDRYTKTLSEYDSLKKATIFGKNEKAGKYYNVRGFRMYVETYGQGKPLLMIHGNGATIADFVKQIPYFSKKYMVIAADSRAHGKSVDKGDSLSYDMMADDFAELLNQMHLDSVFVLGWSDGGINGLLLSMRHPEKVKKLAITGANLWPDTTAISTDAYLKTRKTYNMFRDMFSSNKPKTALDSTVRKFITILYEQPDIHLSELRKIKIPVFVIGGDHDLILASHTEKIYENIPNAYLWIVPDCGHATLVHYTDEFNRKVDLFFSNKFGLSDTTKSEF